ncbi:integrase core domain-containing protein [Chryseobacterium sp.]|uniref:integrase core domain-containing protein n=1 Tax=Chryseobacterium sp. TaxID=1871047 RepID=UPI0035AE54BB
MSLEDAQQKLIVWKHDYNSYRPHSSLGNLTPNKLLTIVKMTFSRKSLPFKSRFSIKL